MDLRLAFYRRLRISRRRDRLPEYFARGVLVGLLIGLTPTFGIQLPIVGALWLAVRKLVPRREFSLPLALAWTWVTNPLTAPPIYYVFVVTGRVMLGRWDKLRGYDTFSAQLHGPLDPQAGWVETVWTYLVGAFDRFGAPMFVGCVPWALIVSWVGYRWSLRLIRARQARRTLRQSRRRSSLRRREREMDR